MTPLTLNGSGSFRLTHWHGRVAQVAGLYATMTPSVDTMEKTNTNNVNKILEVAISNKKKEKQEPVPLTTEEVLEKTSYLKALKNKSKETQRALAKDPELQHDQQFMAKLINESREVSTLMTELGLSGVKKFGNDLKALPARYMSSEPMLLEDMLKLSAVGDLSTKAVAAYQGTQPGARPLQTAWVPPAMPAMLKYEEIKLYLQGIATLKPVASLQRSDKDPYYKPGAGPKNLLTHVVQQQFVPQDAIWIALLQSLGTDWREEEDITYETLKTVLRKYYVGSGPNVGWLKRLREGKSKPHPTFELTDSEFKDLCTALPWDSTRVPKWKEISFLDLLKKVPINAQARAGAPRQLKKGEVTEEITKDAIQYYQLIQENKMQQYAVKNPGEFATFVMAKLDRYEIADWGEKIRPYYASNGGKAFCSSAVLQPYSHALKGFWEDPKSCNAHGFSWNSGGAQRLYEWILDKYQNAPPGVYAIGYSDDGLWIIVEMVGTTRVVIIADLDIKHCDMSLGSSFQKPMVKHVAMVLGNETPEGLRKLAAQAVRDIFTQVVVVQGSITYLSVDQVHSGLPGTPEADQVGFTTAYVIIRNAYPNQIGTPAQKFRACEEILAQRTGIRFKPYVWHDFRPEQNEYPFEFLGKRLKKYGPVYLPVVTLEKAITQCVTPKKSLKGDAHVRAWMERARGLAVTSLWAYPALMSVAMRQFDVFKLQRFTPGATMESEDLDETDFAQIAGPGTKWVFTDDKFPTIAQIKNMYDPRCQSMDIPQKLKAAVVSQTAGQAMETLYPAPTGAWGDEDPAGTLIREPVYVPDNVRLTPSVPQVVPVADQGRVLPLPASVKAAYLKAWAQASALARAAARTKHFKVRVGGGISALTRGEMRDIKYSDAAVREAWEYAWHEEQNQHDFVWKPEEYEDTTRWETVEDTQIEDAYAQMETEYNNRVRVRGPQSITKGASGDYDV